MQPRLSLTRQNTWLWLLPRLHYSHSPGKTLGYGCCRGCITLTHPAKHLVMAAAEAALLSLTRQNTWLWLLPRLHYSHSPGKTLGYGCCRGCITLTHPAKHLVMAAAEAALLSLTRQNTWLWLLPRLHYSHLPGKTLGYGCCRGCITLTHPAKHLVMAAAEAALLSLTRQNTWLWLLPRLHYSHSPGKTLGYGCCRGCITAAITKCFAG